MELVTVLASLVMGATSGQLQPPATIAQPPRSQTVTIAKKPSSPKARMVTVTLLPYEILAGTTTSYADVSLTITNSSNRSHTVTIKQIEIRSAKDRRQLLRSTPGDLKQPAQLVLQPGEQKVVPYRLQAPRQVYQSGQDVVAEVRYQLEQQPEQTARSSSEAVAFMVP